jgi:signal transduction histidine kinase
MQRDTRVPRPVWVAGLATWIACAVPTVLQATGSPRFPVWLAAWLAFGIAFTLASQLPLRVLWLALMLGLESASVVTMVGLLCNGFEGTLLVLVAAQLGLRADWRWASGCIAVQTVALATAIALHWSARPAWLLTPPYLGFQVVAFLVFSTLRRETAARRALAVSNFELRRLHAQLAEQSRLDERLRLAQELHDALGHRLTALSLNLEVAAHQTAGSAHDNIRTAQSLVRLALGDVRDIVRAWKPAGDFDLRDELGRMAAEVPAPAIHVAVHSSVRTLDPDRSHVLLRCAQEVVTNAIRHGQAQNVWIELQEEGGRLDLVARDDGHGVADLRPGDGLAGMRRRCEQMGGTLAVETGAGAGFAVRASLPPRGGAPL